MSELGWFNIGQGPGKRASVMSVFHSWNCRREGYGRVFSGNKKYEIGAISSCGQWAEEEK